MWIQAGSSLDLPELQTEQVKVNQQNSRSRKHFNSSKRSDRSELRMHRQWRSLRLLLISECVSVPPKLCTYAESDWFKGGVQVTIWNAAVWGRARVTSCYFDQLIINDKNRSSWWWPCRHRGNLNPTHTSQKTRPSLVDSCYWNEPYHWQQFELKPHWRLRIIGNIMVDHYVLLYMGCILLIVHMTIFLCWSL